MVIHYKPKYKQFAKSLSDYGIGAVNGRKERVVDYNNTAFTFYPEPDLVKNKPEYYDKIRDFSRLNKLGQRRILSEFFSVPELWPDCDFPCVVRPVNHYGGKDFYIANSEQEIREIARRLGKNVYSSALFERDKEYRHLFIGGKPVVTLFKRVDEIVQDKPWNHSMGSVFMTVNKDKNDKLLKTSFYSDAENFFASYPLDIVAIDTAWNRSKKSYVVFEVNLSPRLSIDTSIESVSNALKNIRIQ